jgi:outer membrane protein assembly factor BamE (lipoprotein component of BamABCDE complex)
MNFGSRYENKSSLISATVVVVALLLSGCAGTNFVRPEPSSFVLGKTTQQEIFQIMGKPYQAGTVEKNGRTLHTASYSYATVGGDALYSGVTAGRTQSFTFLNDTLVGTEFLSSFKEDGTDFDETKVAKIEKGKSTKADVVRLFGPAGGDYIAPLTTNPTDYALVYLYAQMKGSAFNLRFYSKALVVSYNESGVVTDIQYTAQGNKD